MDKDNYGEIINGEVTYKGIAEQLKIYRRVIVGWSDGNGTHLDILFVTQVPKFGSQIQGGIEPYLDLFVAIMRQGAFAFEIDKKDTHASYIEEKLGGGLGSTAEKLAELINGIKKELTKIYSFKTD